MSLSEYEMNQNMEMIENKNKSRENNFLFNKKKQVIVNDKTVLKKVCRILLALIYINI